MQVCSSVAFAGALRRGGWATVSVVPFSLARERGLLWLFGASIIGTFGFNEIPNTLKRLANASVYLLSGLFTFLAGFGLLVVGFWG